MKYLLSFLIGVTFTLIIFLCYCLYSHRVPSVSKELRISCDSVQLKSLGATNDLIVQLPNASGELEEKINSINQRIDDFYIFFGIILTLLLAINISVFVRAEGEVERHFKEHFEKYKQQAQTYANEAEALVSKIRTTADVQRLQRKVITNPKQEVISDEINKDPNNDNDDNGNQS